MADRWRCLHVGCNPRLNAESAVIHKAEVGHRVAAWPVRSAEGKRRAKARNKSGYYDKYNVGAKSFTARGLRRGRGGDGSFVLSGDDYSLDDMSDNDWGVRDV